VVGVDTGKESYEDLVLEVKRQMKRSSATPSLEKVKQQRLVLARDWSVQQRNSLIDRLSLPLAESRLWT
jgi:hypothetical protein